MKLEDLKTSTERNTTLFRNSPKLMVYSSGGDDGANVNWLSTLSLYSIFLTRLKDLKGVSLSEVHILNISPLGYYRLMEVFNEGRNIFWVDPLDFSLRNELIEVLVQGNTDNVTAEHPERLCELPDSSDAGGQLEVPQG